MSNESVAAISRRAPLAVVEKRQPNTIQRINRKVRDVLAWCPPDPTEGFKGEMPWPVGYALIPFVGQAGLGIYLGVSAVVAACMLVWICVSKPVEFSQWLYRKLSPLLFGPED